MCPSRISKRINRAIVLLTPRCVLRSLRNGSLPQPIARFLLYRALGCGYYIGSNQELNCTPIEQTYINFYKFLKYGKEI